MNPTCARAVPLAGLLLTVLSSGCSRQVIGLDVSADGSGGAGGADPMPAADPSADASPSDGSPSDASPADAIPPSDASPTDAGPVTYVEHIQPILGATCSSCHAAGSSVPFVDSYAATQRLSAAPNFYGCPGELIGVCINRAAQIQRVEGSHCRTYDRPFHRDGFDRCITDGERALIMAWVEGGMVER
jgi:hypothetical protein